MKCRESHLSFFLRSRWLKATTHARAMCAQDNGTQGSGRVQVVRQLPRICDVLDLASDVQRTCVCRLMAYDSIEAIFGNWHQLQPNDCFKLATRPKHADILNGFPVRAKASVWASVCVCVRAGGRALLRTKLASRCTQVFRYSRHKVSVARQPSSEQT